MRVSEKIALIDQIAKTMKEKGYSLREVDAFLQEFGLSSPLSWSGNPGTAYYAKAGLLTGDTETIQRIVEDLRLDLPASALSAIPPLAWKNTHDFRLFISHISVNKDKATRLKEALAPMNIAGFVAHADIEPTKPWQVQIERALWSMDAMVAVHTNGFKNSSWTQQEIGFALGRDAKVISLKMQQEDPTGLISKDQALSRGKRTAEDVAKEIEQLLKDDPRTAQRLAEAQFMGSKPIPTATS